MQRMMETLLERRGLAVWEDDRLLRFLKKVTTVYAARGYADYVYGQEERNHASAVSGPFAAERYREGHALAAHELGDLTMGQVIE
jgi:hypothetical protein